MDDYIWEGTEDGGEARVVKVVLGVEERERGQEVSGQGEGEGEGEKAVEDPKSERERDGESHWEVGERREKGKMRMVLHSLEAAV